MENDFNKYWEDALKDWEGSTKHTFGSSGMNLPEKTNLLDEQDEVNTLIHHDDIEEVAFTSDEGLIEDVNQHIKTEEKNTHLVVLDEIARGGMGVVFKGYQKNLEREVAIKKVIDDNQILRNRFVAESKITAFLDHPNIVPVYELLTDKQGDLVLVMKLVVGTSWKDILNQNSLEKNLQILLTIMNAIAFSHKKGIVHNDLKPDNIMVGEFGEFFLMDWGIAVDIREEGQQSSAFPHKSSVCTPIGTPGYMAPELARGKGKDIGPHTDVYLLGSILYEILMGNCPHQGNNFLQILSSVLQRKELLWNENVPEGLKNICLKAMALKPKDRYKDVIEFRQEIEDYLQHRESILLTENAQKILCTCQKRVESGSCTKNEYENLYDDFNQAIASFHQALELWDGNKKAEQWKVKARTLYLKTAIKNSDFGLAQSQLRKLPADDPQISALEEELKKAKELVEYNSITKRVTKIAQCFIFFFCVRQIVVLILPPSSEEIYLTQNGFKSFIISGLVILMSCAVWSTLKRNHRLKTLFKITIFYEVIMVFLLSLFSTSVPYPSNALTTGVYPSALVILMFNIIVLYPPKMGLIVGLVSACAAMANLFASQWLGNMSFPHMIVFPYIAQHVAMVIIGFFVSRRNISWDF